MNIIKHNNIDNIDKIIDIFNNNTNLFFNFIHNKKYKFINKSNNNLYHNCHFCNNISNYILYKYDNNSLSSLYLCRIHFNIN